MNFDIFFLLLVFCIYLLLSQSTRCDAQTPPVSVKLVQLQKFLRRVQSFTASLRDLKSQLENIKRTKIKTKNNAEIAPAAANNKARTYESTVVISLESMRKVWPCRQYSCDLVNVKNVKRNIAQNGTLILPNDRILGTQICGKNQYFITKSKMTVEKIWESCCVLGGIVASPDSREDLDCLGVMQQRILEKKKKVDSFYFTNWLDYNMDGRFISCPNVDRTLPPDLWVENEPNNVANREFIATVELCAGKSCTSGVDSGGFYDSSALVNKRTLCVYQMGTPTPPLSKSQQTGARIEFYTSRAPYAAYLLKILDNKNVKRCIAYSCQDIKVISEMGGENGALILPAKNIKESQICGKKQYFILKKEIAADKHHTYCCELGGFPATPETREQVECLASLHQKYQERVKKFKPDVSPYYMTGWLDSSMIHRFASCPNTSRLVPPELWALGQPDNRGGDELVGVLNLCADCPQRGLHDYTCMKPLTAICEFTLP